MLTSSIIGRDVTLSAHEGEGWFDGYADIRGTVESVIQSDPGDSPYYVVRFESPLELQESGAATPSGFILRRYSHCVVHCRWQGTDINDDEPVSVHVLLVPRGTKIPRSKAGVVGLTIRAWAACVVMPDSRTYPPRLDRWEPDAIIRVTFKTPEEGGRQADIPLAEMPWFGCVLKVAGGNFDFRVTVHDQTYRLGETYDVPIKFLWPEGAVPMLFPGAAVTLWAGKDIAAGSVLEVLRKT